MTISRKTLLALCLSAASSACYATDRLVPSGFATVQAAIDAASSGDRVLIGTAGTYLGTDPIVGKTDVSINIGSQGGNAGTLVSKNITIEAGVAGVILGSPVKVENTSTVTLTNLTVNPGANGSKGIILNDKDTAFPSDFSSANLNGTTVTGCTENGVRLNGANVVTLTNSTVTGSGQQNIMVDGNANHCTLSLTNSTVSNSVNSNGIGLHRQSNLTATDSHIDGNKGFGIFVDSFDDAAQGYDNINLTNTSVSGNLGRSLFYARAVHGTNTNCTMVGGAGSNELLFQYGGVPYNLTFTGCTIDQSAGNGIAITAIDNSITQSTYTFNQCLVVGGTAGVLHTDNESDNATKWNTVVANRSIFRNKADNNSPNLFMEDTKAVLTNCVIDEGTTAVFSGYTGVGNQIKLYHCDIVSRTGSTSTGLCAVDFNQANRAGADAPEIRNCIIDGYQVGVNVISSSPVISNSLINASQSQVIGATVNSANVISGSPNFVTATTGPGTGDFHLQNSSPAISLGVAGFSSTDLGGGARPLPAATRPDAGAYENATGTAAPSAVRDWSLYQ